jgi:ribosomal protein L2
LFRVSKLSSVFENNFFTKQYIYLSKFIQIPQIFFLLLQSPKFKPLSYVEVYPGKGAQYVKSPGTKSFMVKLDVTANLALLKLPSGVHKIFSVYSTTCIGQIPFNDKNLKTQANAGFFKKIGKKSLSRGVAKNPVDHPHGGRNKAIKYQRTP